MESPKSFFPEICRDLSYLVLVMKFIADAMLGRLARWLRFLGFEHPLYYPDKDGRLISIAGEEADVF